MKRVLVLGALGFIGQALVFRLFHEGCRVYTIDNRTRPAHWWKRFTKRDLRRYAPSPQPFVYDEVYQLAADVGGVAYLSGGHDADVMGGNVEINRTVAKWAVGRCGVLVFASSACVYPEFYRSRPSLMPEDAICEGVPANDYGAEKLFSERLYRAHARDYGLNVRVARFGNVYGPGELLSGPRAHMVGDLCRKAISSDVIEVWGDGRQTRSMVYVDDAVDGLIALARSERDCGPVNIAGKHARVRQIAEIIAEASGRSIAYVPGPTGAHSSALDVSKARAVLGWSAKTHLEDGLRATYEWAKAA